MNEEQNDLGIIKNGFETEMKKWRDLLAGL